MDKIPADYWLILYCLLTPVTSHQHLSVDVSLMSRFFRHSLTGAGRLLVTGTRHPTLVQLPGSGRKQ